MPTTRLWAVANQGKVYTLSTSGQQWEELTSSGMDLKRLSAVCWCTWAIGGDHQIYVYVSAVDIPIRYKEVTYENQRWNPKEGFCTRLLPTDRPAWSSKDGSTARLRERIKLPTLSWQWESDWQVDNSYDGECDPEGWSYAVDFPAGYSGEKNWLSYVRRRRWIRVRRYSSMNSWANVPSLHDDPVFEPFIDVCVGGHDIPGGSTDVLAVWTVTVLGRIMFRRDVSTFCPEGMEWIHIATPQSWEVNQISVGPTGLVWAITWNGYALVRVDVSRNNLEGIRWVCVDPPSEDSKLLQVSVGTNAVWAITRDNKVWFRKGIKGTETVMNEENSTGSGWVEMVGEMSLISVGPNDQVWSLGADERKIVYLRTGVTPTELSGKTWQPIILQCLTRDNICYNDSSEETVSSLSLSSVTVKQQETSVNTAKSEIVGQNNVADESSSASQTVGQQQCHKDFTSADIALEEPGVGNNSYDRISVLSEEISSKCTMISGSGVQRNSSGLTSLSFEKCHGPSLSSLQTRGWHSSEDTGYFDDTFGECSWSWISGSGCFVDGRNLPNWFCSGLYERHSWLLEPWHKEIVSLLANRHAREVENFTSYEQATEKSSWMVTVKGQVLVEGKQCLWDDCKLELEKTKEEDGLESAVLRCFPQGIHSAKDKFVFDMKTVMCVVCQNDRQKRMMVIHTSQNILDRMPLYITLSSDSELDDWLVLLSNTCCMLRGIYGAPSIGAIWSLTSTGDIFVHDPLSSDNTTKLDELYWRQLGGHLRIVESCREGIVWGIGYDNTVWVYTGGWGGGFFKGMDSSSSELHLVNDVRCMYVYENQRWNPLTGFSNQRLPTDRCTWSDKSGRRECTRENMKLPSIHWHWITEWMVDFDTTGGVDKDGWQYAKDFPMEYHAKKRLTDYVRRRRWHRKCQLTTLGPWEELESFRLLDVSLYHSECPITPVHVWGVSVKGEVLCRIGVTKSCPKGIYWEHVSLDQTVQSICVGGGGVVWVIARNGHAFLRHGVTDTTPTGSVWFSVGPPHKGNLLRNVSVGVNMVWAIDTSNNLWCREEIMPIFPEGVSWTRVCSNVRCVSVSPDNEVWAVVDIPNSTSGVVCRRIGVASDSKIGTDWEYGIGGRWQYISVRGFVPRLG